MFAMSRFADLLELTATPPNRYKDCYNWGLRKSMSDALENPAKFETVLRYDCENH